MSRADDGARSALWLVLAILAGLLLFLWFVNRDNRPAPPPSDDPYYDAPIGRTYKGDTY